MIRYPLYENAILIAPASEKGFFSAYRKAYPDQRFDVLTIEAVEEMFLYQAAPEATETLIQRGYAHPQEVLEGLRHFQVGATYKSEKLRHLQPLFEEFLRQGLLYQSTNPYDFFRGRPIVIRGYADGKRIAASIESLPNIALSWDQIPPKRTTPIPLYRFASREEEIETLSHAIEADLSAGEKDIVIFGLEPKDLPFSSPLITFTKEKTVPVHSRVYIVDFSRENFGPVERENGVFSEEECRELKLPDAKELARRDAVESQALLQKAEVVWVSYPPGNSPISPWVEQADLFVPGKPQ